MRYHHLNYVKVFVSASLHDSGNIALDEALACGTPGVIYDLAYLNYPKGVVKIPSGDHRRYQQMLVSVIQDDALRAKLSQQAVEFAKSIDWEITSENILEFMKQT